MSKQVEERVVSMQFDNSRFERNVSQSMSTLDKLKQKLNFNGASKGLENVQTAASKVDMHGLANNVETVRARFSALEVMGVTALANITNSAVNAGKRMVAALTIEPIKAGFQEYETQMNSVQTILANTQKEGTNVKVVNKALDELNTYADKTIYNFTEMTRNIGTFTAAGVKLDTSVSSIKGIANLAAVSGSTSQQASTAMYQLSQAIASGTVKLMDWNSVVNAGMGGQVFQDALIRTSEHLKTGAKAAVAAKGSFRESLSTGWLTTEVLTQTLDQFSTAADTQEEYEAAVKKFVEQGYSQEEAKQMADMAKTAGEAATKVKTFTQLIDTLKEALGSGWTTTWRLIIGDFEEAKKLWTEVSDYFSEAINNSSEARNKMIKGWAEGGGRTMLIDSLKNAFEGLMSVVMPIKEAFREVFPPTTSEQLLKITERVKEFTEKLKLSSKNAERVKRIFKGVFSIFDLGKKALTAFMKPLFDFSQSKGIGNLADMLLEAAASIGDFFTSINEGTSAKQILSNVSDALSKAFGGVSKIFESATNGLRGFGNVFKSVWSWISKVAGKIGTAISTAFKWITENVSVGDIFAGLLGGGIFVTLKKFSGLLDKIKEAISNVFDKKVFEGGIGDKFKSILDKVHDSLESFTSGIKIASLVSIAIAIGILSASLKSIAALKISELSKGLFGIGGLLAMLSMSFKSLTKSLSKFDSKGVVKAGIAMIAMSIAIKILSKALVEIAGLKFTDILKGLFAIGVGLLGFVGILKLLDKTDGSIKSAITMILVAEACKILGDALASLGSLSWEEIRRGLTAMGGALAEITAVTVILGKYGKGGSLIGAVSMLIMVQSLDEIYEALKNFGSMAWEEIRRGLTAMGVALAELGFVIGLLGKFGGTSSLVGAVSILIVAHTLDEIYEALKNFGSMAWEEIRRGLTAMGGALAEITAVTVILGKYGKGGSLIGAVSMLIMVQSLDEIYEALKNFGSMAWEEIRRGLTAMGVALAELGFVIGLLGKFGGTSSLVGAVSILIVAHTLDEIYEALKGFGSMSREEIGRGLVAMGGALIELAAITGLLGTLAPGTGLLGAVTILIVAQALKPIGEALSDIGQLSWSEIARGLVGMGGALTELAVITGLLGNLGGLGALLGAGTILLAVQGLGDLADALKKFGEMSWDEIGRGLTAMGAALGEVALGSLLNTLSGLGAKSISEVAGPLGTLADSVKKWSDVTIPENLASQLGSLAWGIMKFTFGESGAGAIAEVAGPLGVLADSVKKWADVTVPEGLGEQMSALADGVMKFTFAGIGAGGLSASAEPLGVLADSVSKWANVTVPAGIGEQLTSLANGVKSFSFAFAGGWSIGQINEPLSNLADTVTKWKDVNIPEGLSKQLTSLANGVKSFSFAFAGGWSISSILEPLGNLADTVKKWSDVKVPEGIEKSLTNIANGIKQFGLMDAAKISAIDEPLKTFSAAFKNFGNITGTGENLVTFATNIKDCGSKLSGINTGAINTASSAIDKLISVIKKVNDTNTGNVAPFVNAANKLNNIKIDNIKVDAGNLSSAISSIKKIMESMSKTISSSKSSLESAMRTAVSGLSTAVKSKESSVSSAGKSLASALEKAIKSKKSSINSACKSLVSGCASAVREKVSSMESAGKDLGRGLVRGINSKKQAAYDAGFALGQKAVQGEKDGQDSASPSKATIKAGKWLGEGLAIGIQRIGKTVYNSAYGLGETATGTISKAVSNISDIINSDMDTQPTIRPVLDLSDVRAGAGSMNALFSGRTLSVDMAGVGSVSASMAKFQNGNDSKEIVSSIKALRKDIADMPRNTYTINGVTYDDGTNVSDAVGSLVRAIKIERRT